MEHERVRSSPCPPATGPWHKGKVTWHPALAGRQPEGLTDGELADALHAMPATCSLDVAEAPRTQEEVAEVLGIVKQGVNAAETRVLRKLAGNARIVRKLSEWL